MEYSTTKNQIIINDLNEFSLDHIFECGQVFRYQKYEDKYEIISKDKHCVLNCENTHVIISTNEIKYFENYFDLQNNYADIKKELAKYPFMKESIEFAGGLRILKQDPEEMILSFIVSANNNIPRIKKILNKLSEEKGKDLGGLYSFPTAYELRDCTEDFYKGIGAGYRANYLFETVRALNSGFNIESIFNMEVEEARNYLMQLKGVGRKVADCILLFAFHKTECFPTDTWMERVFEQIFDEKVSSAKKKSLIFGDYFGRMSGYAQQYLFYYTRETYNKK